MFLDMAYSWCVTQETHSLTRNRANVPLPFVTGRGSITDIYTNQFGVPTNRLGIVFPWYGCSYKCTPGAVGDAYGGCPVVGPEFALAPRYASMARWRENATGPVVMNQTLATKYFNYKGGDGQGTEQVWYDDAQTLAVKYSAAKGAGIRGLGMWTADSAGDDPNDVASMWNAIPAL